MAALCGPLLAMAGPLSLAQTPYKYRDANGQWVFSDRAPATSATSSSLPGDAGTGALLVSVDRDDRAGATLLVAVNDCLCVATFDLLVGESRIPAIPTGSHYTAILDPGTRQTLLQAPLTGKTLDLQYTWKAALGTPDAIHSPARPYRAPFAVGSSYEITQAYPTRLTHITPDSAYAVDIALPEGAHVYSAREGTVINVSRESLRNGPVAAQLDQANGVQILHGDGTIAVYAHLNWESIHVRIGERIARGQYLADAGKVDPSSGPYLHFAVLRNSGANNVSLPIQFASNNGSAVTPTTHMTLTAY